MLKSAKRTSTVEYPEGYSWNFGADYQIQPFTAERSGTYKVELWGADGDSDTNWPKQEAAGVGGQGGYTTAEIHLNKGETIYLGLGFRNGFSDKRSWNGGGTGWGLWAGWAAGGGGAAALYSEDINGSATSPSTTELSGYANNRDKVLLVAGGGGGGENYFARGEYPYPCDDGHCHTAYGGGGGGTTGGRGSAVHDVTVGNPGTQTSGYAFGQGQDYPTSTMDASTGAGGGGWYGGYAVENIRYESGKALQGGSGGGGSGYINTTYIDSSGQTMKNASMTTGGHVNFNYDTATDDGQNARAKITFQRGDEYTLTVQYLQRGTETVLHEENVYTLKKGDAINAPVYYLSGYTVTGEYAFTPAELTETNSGITTTFPTSDYFDMDDLVSEDGRDADEAVTGTMPAENLVLKIYYDYPLLRIRYIDYETKDSATPTEVAPVHEEYLQPGQTYNVLSPEVSGYLHDIGTYETYNVSEDLTVDDAEVIDGTKTDRNEFYIVYYVPLVKPVKSIIEKNGMTVSKAVSGNGVQLMANDEYTYSISWENKQHAARTITLTDTLPDNIELIDGTISDGGVYDTTARTITWTVNAPARTSQPGGAGSTGTVTFRAKVNSDVMNGTVVNNVDSSDCEDSPCVVRIDPVVSYDIIKSADPVSGSDVAFDQVITYYIDVKNTGEVAINNLAVVDYIPENMGDMSDGEGRYPSANHDYHGEYHSDGNYVSYLIDELPVGAVARLSFKAVVTARQESTERLTITNFAYHGVLPINNPTEEQYLIVVNPDGDDSTDDGKKTNEVVHYAIGPKVDVIKSADPVSGTKVSDGQRIDYTVDLTNTGTVNTNWVRLVDKIPVGTTYVPNSLGLVSDNTASNNKYAWMNGDGFDVHYDFTTSQYRLDNIATADNIHRITVTWPSGLTIVSGTYGSGTVSGNTLTYESSSAIAESTQKTYLQGIRWSGNYSATGSISVKFTRHNTQTVNNSYTTPGTYTVTLPATNNQAQTYTIKAKGGQGGGGSAATEQSKTVSVTNGGTATLVVGAGGSAPSTKQETQTENVWMNTAENRSNGTQQNDSPRFTGTITSLYMKYSASGVWSGDGGSLRYSVGIYNSSGTRVWYSGEKTATGGGEPAIEATPNISVTNGFVRYWKTGGNNAYGWGSFDYTHQVTVPVAGGTGGTSSVTTTGGSVTGSGTAGTTSGSSAGANGSASISGTASWYTDIKTSSSSLPSKGDSKGCKYIPAGTVVGGVTVSESYVECLTSDLEPGQSAKMTFGVTVNSGASDSYDEIDNIALYETKFTVDDSYAGTNPEMPTQETNMTVHPLGDVVISAAKSSDPVSGTVVRRSDDITYHVTINNTSNKPAQYVHVRDYIPDETTYAGGITDDGVYVAASQDGGNYVEWVLSVPANSSKTVSFNVNVNADAIANYMIINKALYELKAENPGPVGRITMDPANETNQVYHTVTGPRVLPVHDITVAKYGEVSNPYGSPSTGHDWEETAPTVRSWEEHDSLITYTLRAVSSGGDTAGYTRIRDYIPEGTEFVPDSFEFIKSPTADRFSPDISETHTYSEQGNYVEWIIYNLGAQDYVDVTYKVKIGKYTVIPAEGDRDENVIHNTAYYQEEMTDPGAPGTIAEDPEYETNEVRTPLVDPHVTITEIADPATVNVADGASEVKRRQIITYKMNITNDTGVFLNYAVVESNIPQYTSYVEDSIYAVEQDAVKVYDTTGKSARYILKDMEPGETQQVSFKVQVSDVTPFDTNIVSYSLVKGYIQDPVTPEDLPEPAGTRDVNGGEGYSNQQVHLLSFDAPPTLPDPYKRLSGGTTVVEGFENAVDYTNNEFTYDIYQVIPAEEEKAYFSSFVMRDALPANILAQNVKVFADSVDVTDQFEYQIMTNEADPDNISNTVLVTAKPEYLATADAYGKTYDFRIGVKVSNAVQKTTIFLNSAKFMIHYNDSEIEQNAPYGNTDSTSDGDPATRTTNTVKTTFTPKIPFKKIWADEDGYLEERPASIMIHLVGSDGSVIDQQLTANDNWEIVFDNVPGYTVGGEKITYTMYEDEFDMYDTSAPQAVPVAVKFNELNTITNTLVMDFPVEKHVYNTNDVDIDTKVVQNNQRLHYVITVTNPTSVTKKFDVEDVIPANSAYVTGSASNSGVYDDATKKITWTDVQIAGHGTGTVSFDVTAVGQQDAWATIPNFADVWMKRTNGARITRYKDPVTQEYKTSERTNTVNNYVPPVRLPADDYKQVTDAAGTDIDTLYVEKDRNLYYHIPVTNGSPLAKTFTITDTVPENTTFVSVGQSGSHVDGTITWVANLAAGETKTFEFVVKVNNDNCDIENTAHIAVDSATWDTNTVYNHTGKIVIDKAISNYYANFGATSFLFKVTGSDGSVGYRMIEVTNHESGSTEYVIPMYTEEDVQFTVSELRNARYEYQNLEIVSGAATKSGETAVTTFSDEHRIAEVRYTDGINEYSKASHADSVTNTID